MTRMLVILFCGLLFLPSLMTAATSPDMRTTAGRVVDSDGAPISGAVVMGRYLNVPGGQIDRALQGKQAKTAADGRFVIPGLTRGSPIDLSVRAEGYALTFRTKIRPGEPDQIFRLFPEGIVEGKVTFGDEKPAAGVTVTLIGNNPWLPENILTSVTDSRGAYRIANVPSGMVTVTVVSGKRIAGWAPGASALIEVHQGKTTSGVDIRLARGGEVAGKITDRDTGKPIAGVRVYASFRGLPPNSTRVITFTDRSGVYRVRGAAGAMYLQVDSPKDFSRQYPNKELKIEEGKTLSGIDFTFSRGGTLKGSVLLPDGSPAARVSIRPDFEAREYAWFENTVSDKNGIFILQHVEAGCPVILIAENKKLNLARRGTFRSDEDIVVRLESYGTLGTVDISGRVLDDERNPVPDAEITLGFVNPLTGEYNEPLRTFTDSLGEYRFSGTPVPGRFSLGIEASGFRRRSVSVDSTGAMTRRLPDIVLLQTDRFIEGTVSDAAGNPVEDATVRVVTGCCDEHVETRTNARGRFRLDGLMHLMEPEVYVSHTNMGGGFYTWVETNARHNFTLLGVKRKRAIPDWEAYRREGLLLEGKPAPALDVSQWLIGGPVRLDELKGKIVVLHFFSGKNGEDEASYRLMKILHRLYGRDGVVVIGIHEYTGDIESVRRFCAERGIDYPVAVDSESPNEGSRGKTFGAFGFAGFPHHVIIDRGGLVNMPGLASDDHTPVGPNFGDPFSLDIDSKVRRMRASSAP